ncbi:MAG: hypothetical protein ACEY3B_06850 [Wolbachia sp.]
MPKLEHYHGALVINLSKAYPDIWERFKQTQAQSQSLTFNPSAEIFPTYIKNPELDSEDSIYIVPKMPNTCEISLTINNYSWDHASYKLSADEGKKLAIGSNWNLKINGEGCSQIEEIIVVIPYKAKITW